MAAEIALKSVACGGRSGVRRHQDVVEMLPQLAGTFHHARASSAVEAQQLGDEGGLDESGQLDEPHEVAIRGQVLDRRRERPLVDRVHRSRAPHGRRPTRINRHDHSFLLLPLAKAFDIITYKHGEEGYDVASQTTLDATPQRSPERRSDDVLDGCRMQHRCTVARPQSTRGSDRRRPVWRICDVRVPSTVRRRASMRLVVL